jgi:hypothetical protein
MFGVSSASKKIIAVADVGSGSAAVALLVIQKNAPATVIAVSRTILALEERASDATAKAIVSSLIEVGTKALALYAESSYKDHAIKSIYAIIRAPWARSKTERASSIFEKDTRITDAMISALAQQAVAADTELDRSRIFESAVIRVELNGYPTGAPVGKAARSLSTIVLISDCEGAIRSGLDETMQQLFPDTKMILRSGARALLSAVKDKAGSDYVILDIEGEASNVIVVRDGLATEHLLIPEGVRSILKRVSEKGLPEETLSLLRMMQRDESSTEAISAIGASVARVEIELARVYGEGLTKIAGIARLPTTLVLITHPDLVPWLTKFFSRIDFTQCTITAQPFVVHALQVKDLAGSVVAADTLSIDIGIAIAGALVNTEEER